MPSTLVQANAEGMPKFDRAAIMTLAWAIFRKRFPDAAGKPAAYRRWAFSIALKSAWMTAKYEASQSARTPEQKRTDRINELKLEIMRLDARPFGMRDDLDRRAAFTSQFNILIMENVCEPHA